jgi:hypothetical protein
VVRAGRIAGNRLARRDIPGRHADADRGDPRRPEFEALALVSASRGWSAA